MQKHSIVYSQDNCQACTTAKVLLLKNGYTVEERKIGYGYSKKDLIDVVPGARSVPQIMINNTHIGGLSELRNYLC